jgi:hypothetical protein
VNANRGRLVAAALNILRSWIAAGRPPGEGHFLGSYEQWSEVLGGALSHAGVKGFLGNKERVYETAVPETKENHSLIAAWWDMMQGDMGPDFTQMTTRGLYDLARAASLELGFTGNEDGDKKSLGWRMRRMTGQVITIRPGLRVRVVNIGDVHHVTTYVLEILQNDSVQREIPY